MKKNDLIIVLFRQDLRLRDNPALWHAAQTGARLLLLYVMDEINPGKWCMGKVQQDWLWCSLKRLSEEVRSRGGSLTVCTGDTREIIKKHQPQAVYCNRCYEPHSIKLEKEINATLFEGALLCEPLDYFNKQGTPYKVFTPFWNELQKVEISDPLPIPKLENCIKIAGEKIPEAKVHEMWEPGEAGAHKALARFSAKEYEHLRDIPSVCGTSLLSPHLHFGEISPREICYTQKEESFVRELAWRDFNHYLLYHFPHIPDIPFQERFRDFPWKNDSKAFSAWKNGLVGYPIVDAGMRQLSETGWMHNRVRMIVASFLTKHLMVPWQEGEKWFWEKLVDADLANNAANWQWVAGCGADAAPYFRIFNPVLQGEKFDPEGLYVKKWVPELRDVPAKYIHKPWEFPLGAAKYPEPIVDHAFARERALRGYKTIN